MSTYHVYFALEKKLQAKGFAFDRHDVIQDFTDGRKSGLRELSAAEYSGLINHMNQLVNRAGVPEQDSGQKQRRKLIALLAKIGMVKDGKADMQRIYSWVLSHGYLHKALNEYRANQLPKLIIQAEEFYRKHIERL